MTFVSKIVLFLVFLLIVNVSMAQPNGAVKRKLRKNKLEFFMPQGFVYAPVVPNSLLPSDFAITKGGEQFEIRYQISPLKKDLKAYRKNLKNPTVKLIHPNYLWKTRIRELISTLALPQESAPEVREFSEEAFNAEFVGDGGGICFFPVSSEAKLGYSYAITMVIHRNFLADVYVTFLGNDREKLEELSLEAFRAVRFKA